MFVQVIHVVSRCQDFAFVDIVNAECFQDFCFDNMADSDFGHNGDADGGFDFLNHFGVAHAGYAAFFTDVGRNAFQGHNCNSAGFFSNPCFFNVGNVHDDAAFEHLS